LLRDHDVGALVVPEVSRGMTNGPRLSATGLEDSALSGDRMWRRRLRLVVEEAAAVLAGVDLAGLAHLVEALGRQGHAATGADPVAADERHREAGTPLEEPPILREEVSRDVARHALPLAPRNLEVRLERPQLFGGRGFLDPRLRFLGPQARLALHHLAAEPLLELHQREDLLLEAVLFDLCPLDLGECGGVLLVRLHLVELRLELLPLGALVLELLLLDPHVLAGAVELGADRVDARFRLLKIVTDRLDAPRYRLELPLEPGDPAVENLELLEMLEMRIHHLNGGPTRTRTRTRPVMSRRLCQLSYGPDGADASRFRTAPQTRARMRARHDVPPGE